jgi:hypothetical protein
MEPEQPFVRATDPYTSVGAALRAAAASAKAVAAVARLMNDGQARIDHEIWLDCRAAGYVASIDTVRHGRLALSETGLIVETGETRITPNGMPARVWQRGVDVLLPDDEDRLSVEARGSAKKTKRPSKAVLDAAVEDLQALARAGVVLTPAIQELMRWLAGPSDEVAIAAVETRMPNEDDLRPC